MAKQAAKSTDNTTRWIVIAMVALVIVTGVVFSLFSQNSKESASLAGLDGTTLKPAEMWEKIDEMATETNLFETVRNEEKKKFELVSTEHNVRIKVKFFECPEEKTLKVSFIKK